MMFYRYISENLANYINDGERAAGDTEFDYAKLSDDDFAAIEAEMQKIIKANPPIKPFILSREEAKKLMRWACKKEGIYIYPAYNQIIKDMGLDSELKYMPEEEWLNS